MNYSEIINSIVEELEFTDENEKEVFWNGLMEDVDECLTSITSR